MAREVANTRLPVQCGDKFAVVSLSWRCNTNPGNSRYGTTLSLIVRREFNAQKKMESIQIDCSSILQRTCSGVGEEIKFPSQKVAHVNFIRKSNLFLVVPTTKYCGVFVCPCSQAQSRFNRSRGSVLRAGIST